MLLLLIIANYLFKSTYTYKNVVQFINFLVYNIGTKTI